ncbi:heterokaryon incompatibility protein, partial [Colletotrichum asianum]
PRSQTAPSLKPHVSSKFYRARLFHLQRAVLEHTQLANKVFGIVTVVIRAAGFNRSWQNICQPQLYSRKPGWFLRGAILSLGSWLVSWHPVLYKRSNGGTTVLPVMECLEAAQQWMRVCSETHHQCRDRSQPASYPTRLLEIGATGVRLIQTAQQPPSGPYAALSYCWGPPPHDFLRLTTSNISHLLRSEIPYDALPLAFREALSFIRALGLNFMWIDCLCIIQEGAQSQQDWTAESSKMESVFSNCDICLSLYRARSPHESIFNGPVPQFTAPFEINTAGIFKGNDVDGNGSTKCAVFSRLYFKNALFRQPLGSRAWALQERLLPDRLLGFGAGELFWSCKQMPYACESMPYGAPDRSQSLQVSSLPSTSDFIDVAKVEPRLRERNRSFCYHTPPQAVEYVYRATYRLKITPRARLEGTAL